MHVNAFMGVCILYLCLCKGVSFDISLTMKYDPYCCCHSVGILRAFVMNIMAGNKLCFYVVSSEHK